MDVPKVAGEILIILVLVGWITFWASIALLNYLLGDLRGAAVTGLIFVLSALAILVWRFGSIRERVTAS